MREVFLYMKYNLTTLKIYFKQEPKFKFFCQIVLKYRKIVFKYWKYILNTLKSVSKYIWFGKGLIIDMSVVVVVICASCTGYDVLKSFFAKLFLSKRIFWWTNTFPAPQCGFKIFLTVILRWLVPVFWGGTILLWSSLVSPPLLLS